MLRCLEVGNLGLDGCNHVFGLLQISEIDGLSVESVSGDSVVSCLRILMAVGALFLRVGAEVLEALGGLGLLGSNHSVVRLLLVHHILLACVDCGFLQQVVSKVSIDTRRRHLSAGCPLSGGIILEYREFIYVSLGASSLATSET